MRCLLKSIDRQLASMRCQHGSSDCALASSHRELASMRSLLKSNGRQLASMQRQHGSSDCELRRADMLSARLESIVIGLAQSRRGLESLTDGTPVHPSSSGWRRQDLNQNDCPLRLSAPSAALREVFHLRQLLVVARCQSGGTDSKAG
jgi:hypothetical protein